MKLENVFYGDKIAVAVSGGKDSVCLLHLLLNNKEKLNIEIIAVNVDHGIRGKESENDSLFVKNYCEKLGVTLYFKKVDAATFSKENKLSLENGARVLRYEFFSEVLQKNKGFKIATAHHKNDLFESVLINLFRGTGLKGLKGIDAISNTIVRPILNATREEIDAYVTENNLPYVVDSTNFDDTYTRNYVRNELTPLILNKFPKAIESVSNLTKLIAEENDFLEVSSNALIFNKGENLAIKTNGHPAIVKRAIITAIKKCGMVKDYTKLHVDAVYNLTTLETGSKITLKQGLTAVKEYGEIVFYTANLDGENYDANAQIPFGEGEFTINGIVFKIQKSATKNFTNTKSGVNYFDGDKIPSDAVIRFRKYGDFFTKFGGGTKNLADFFTDKKIPLAKRDLIPLIATGSEVLVVLGVEISEKVKITTDSEYILKSTV